MRKAFLIICCLYPACLLAQTASSIIPDSISRRDTLRQKDLIDIGKSIINIKPTPVHVEKGKKVYFSLLPFGGNVPGGNGRAFVTSTTASTYFGPKATTNESSVNFAPYWNFGSRFGIPLRNSLWYPNNTYTIQGDIRFLRYPQYTWGLGNATGNDRSLVDYNYIRFYQSVLKRISPFFFAGLGYDLDFHSNVHADEPNIDLKQFTHYQNGTAGSSFSSGITFNALFDSRNHQLSIMPGSYGNIVYRINPTFLGSNDYWSSLYLDVRKYISLNHHKQREQNTLAFWSYFWTAFNGDVPYLDLPSIGWDPYNRSGRGMDQNRYRGRSLFYFESEYRRDITDNGLFGFVIFTNINTVSGSGSLFTSWHPALGSGIRVKFNKASATNLGFDYGFSKGYNGFQVNLGEAF